MAIASEYAFPVQVNLIFALIALHNFIRLHSGQGDIYEEADGNSEEEDEANNAFDTEDTPLDVQSEMDQLRDSIATSMWEDYKQYR